jgi:hypothetical protein
VSSREKEEEREPITPGLSGTQRTNRSLPKKRTFAGKKRAWWPWNMEPPNTKSTDTKERKGHHTHPNAGDGHHHPVWYGHHPHGS